MNRLQLQYQERKRLERLLGHINMIKNGEKKLYPNKPTHLESEGDYNRAFAYLKINE